MTIKDILNRIEYTVIIDGVEKPSHDILFSAWNENMVKQSEKASGYTPEKMFDPVARDNYQKYIALAYYAGLIPAKVVETRTNEIGVDGCYVFTFETFGTLEPETDAEDATPTREEVEAVLQESEEAEARAQVLITELRGTTEAAEAGKGNNMDYNYLEAVTEDVREYIRENINLSEWKGNRDGLEEKMNDALWVEDSVTGNASGSYTFSRYQAEEYLAHNWDLLAEALEEFGADDVNPIDKGAEWCDVMIRCYLLGQAIGEVLDELEDELEEDDSEEEV